MKKNLSVSGRTALLVISCIFTLLAARTENVVSDLYTSSQEEQMQTEYEKQWENVEEALKNSLPKTALEIVEKIYRRAKTEKNQPQIIKALSYRVALLAEINEDGEVILIKEIEKEIAESRQPVKAILQSILAELYWRYYQNNRWMIFGRTRVEGMKQDDFRTWSASAFFDKISALYLKSLESRDELRKIPVKEFEYILIKEKESEKYRPTLFDILAHRALEFFQNDEMSLPKPEREFEITDFSALLPAKEFTEQKFSSPDITDPKYRAILLHQTLTHFHLNDKQPDALVDLDLIRLKFTRQLTYHPEKDTAYYKILANIAGRYSESPMSAQVHYEMSRYLYDSGEYIRALELCEREMKRFPGSRGAVNCEALRLEILRKELRAGVEKTVLPDAPFLISLEYRNVSKVYCRIVQVDTVEDEDFEYYRGYESRDEKLKKLIGKNPLRSWSQNLPVVEDYKTHWVDMKGPELPLGKYVLLASPNETFSMDSNAIAYVNIFVTRLTLQHQELSDGSIIAWVQDAASGNPLQGVTVLLFSRKWDYGSRKYEKTLLRTLTTDRNGKITLSAGEYHEDIFLMLRYKDDELPINQRLYPYRHGESKERMQTLFFTDRSIYRPGQTVYFKGILLKGNEEKAEYAVVPKKKTSVTFYDINRQKLSEQTFLTNEYGSFNGIFSIPGGVLTGMMTIRNESGSVSFRVEEYKRPKFEVELKRMTGSYRLHDTLLITGMAKSYAGANIDGAAVQYRVVRRAIFPFWWDRWRPIPSSGEKEIAHGKTQTNEIGEFIIRFPAIPDRSVEKKDHPVFTYTILADVTDLNGETRSGSTSVSVGYTAIQLAIVSKENYERNEKEAIRLISMNMNGELVSAEGKIVIEKLRPPEKIFRERYLPKPDQYLLSEKEFSEAFPQDFYRDENDQDKWLVERVVLDGRFHTGEHMNDSIFVAGYAQGRYRITLTLNDPSGENIVVKRFFTVFDASSKILPVTSPAAVIPVKIKCFPGETASIIWGTSYKDARVFYQVEHRGKILSEEWLTMNQEQRCFDIPIKEEYRGGISVRFSMVRESRHYSQSIWIDVPWSNKHLHIETSTFRDKLSPGQKEEWRLIIKDEKAKAVAAEMVATMYDASLDAIYKRDWQTFSWPLFSSWAEIHQSTFGSRSSSIYENNWNRFKSYFSQEYDRLNLFLLERTAFPFHTTMQFQMRIAGMGETALMAAPKMADMKKEEAIEDKAMEAEGTAEIERGEQESEELAMIKARKDFNETAFFYPQLATNDSGEVILKFTVPEALTRWKMLAFAHTPDLSVGSLERFAVTQKELMVIPNAPRFFREQDEITFPAKITNLSENALRGTAKLMLFDAITMQPVDALFKLMEAEQKFTAEKGRSVSVSWKLSIPQGVSAIVFRVVAKAGTFSDGEEAPLAILPNRMLVTESLPLNIRGMQTKEFVFEKLAKSDASTTLQHHRLTLEMTSNPAWYAVQALPYMMEFPYECSEQVFNRYYSNSIASYLVNSNPKIKRVFEQWKSADALISNLEKNQDLKSVLLQETPWVMQAQDESERKKRISLLFDLNTLTDNLDNAIRKLEKAQTANGGWPWFPGMPESRHISQYIVAGFGHLKALGIQLDDPRIKQILARAINFIDERMKTQYEELKRAIDTLDHRKDYLGYLEIQYLYSRSFFLEQKVDEKNSEAFNFWLEQAKKFWTDRSLIAQGMIALATWRFKDTSTPKKILASLRERALHSEEMGMYWKQERGCFWHQAEIETQALLIEVFDEIANDTEAVEELKIWLLKQKQVQDWRTTIATAEACYALLRRGSDLLASEKLVETTVGGKRVDPGKTEAGTGYYQKTWSRTEIKPEMSNIVATKTDKGIAWGAVYWQYFEQLDKITPHETPLKIDKKLFRQVTSEKGVSLEPLSETNVLHVGDILKVRIEIRVDRNMEYVHLKDMRGAGFEPLNQLSGYKWQGGIGYYETPKDASMNFFIDWLAKGVYVFEYPLRVTHEGRFSNGITTIQSMYAPEFAGHTQGLTVHVR